MVDSYGCWDHYFVFIRWLLLPLFLFTLRIEEMTGRMMPSLLAHISRRQFMRKAFVWMRLFRRPYLTDSSSRETDIAKASFMFSYLC